VNTAIERNRLRWRCRRGLLELDVLLGRFLEQRYDALSSPERHAFTRLLWVPDETLRAWLLGGDEPSDQELRNIVMKVR
jgi:antitoxin CptB